MQICISSSSCYLSSFNITTIIFMKEKDVKKKNFLYAIMHAIFDLLYKLPSACHFRQLSVSSFDLLCTWQSTKAKFEPKIIAFHHFLFSSSQVFVKQTYNTTNGHYKFIEKSICGSPTQNIISWFMQCLEMNCFSTSSQYQ